MGECKEVLNSIWAKFDRETGEALPLSRHMSDVGHVAGLLWDRQLASATKNFVTDHFQDEDLARRVVVWLAVLHDLGKASPAFAVQALSAAERMESAGLKMTTTLRDKDRSQSPHSVVSFYLLADWLYSKGWSYRCAKTFAAVPGGHHGTFPPDGEGLLSQPGTRMTGRGPLWLGVQQELLEYAMAVAGVSDDDLALLANRPLPQSIQLILTACTVMADWIGSDVRRFPISGDGRSSVERAAEAMSALNLPPPWSPSAPASDLHLFETRFALPPGSLPRPVQLAAARTAREMAEPELMIIEAPTGEGKTAAALAAVEILAERFKLGGFVFALPTCATSDGIFPTIMQWSRTVVPEGAASIVLAHGRAQFNDEYQGLYARTAFRPKGICEADGETVAHWWLTGKRASALADFMVCTIDQVLMAALSTRHVALRHLGLSGKVVVLDEVHAADDFMTEYLHRVLEWLGAMRVPVIAMTATLPPAQRVRLLEAYNYARKRPTAILDAIAGGGYPLISMTSPSGAVSEPIAKSARSLDIEVDELAEDPEMLAAAVREAAEAGGCIAVVCNTVTRAQRLFDLLAPHLGDRVVLLHSRFLAGERTRLETDLRAHLGPGTTGTIRDPLVVVATQVVEQSLDVDFDLMFTDLAPLDLIIQRAGRLHRHQRSRSRGMERARLIVTGFRRRPSRAPELDRGSALVYGKASLFRALAVLDAHGSILRAPDDVAPLVHAAYDPELKAPAGWESEWEVAREKAAELKTSKERRADQFRIRSPRGAIPLQGWSDLRAEDSADDARSHAQVRDAEDSLEVVVVQRVDGLIRGLEWAPGVSGQLDLGPVIEDDLARAVARCTVRFPAYFGVGALGDAVIDDLEQNKIDSWQNSRWLGGMLALILDEELRAEVAGFDVEYDRRRGLLITRKDG